MEGIEANDDLADARWLNEAQSVECILREAKKKEMK